MNVYVKLKSAKYGLLDTNPLKKLSVEKTNKKSMDRFAHA